MNTWAPLFSKIVDSSIWCEPDHVVKVFLTMLAKKDSDQVVRCNAFVLGSWAKKTEAEALDALKVLSSPDTRRIEPQPFEGRRIEKVDGGWKILNGQGYEEEMRRISRAAYKAKWMRDERQRAKGPKPELEDASHNPFVSDDPDSNGERAKRAYAALKEKEIDERGKAIAAAQGQVAGAHYNGRLERETAASAEIAEIRARMGETDAERAGGHPSANGEASGVDI